MAQKKHSKPFGIVIVSLCFASVIFYVIALNYMENSLRDLSDFHTELILKEKELLSQNHLAQTEIKQLSRRVRIEPLAEKWCGLSSPQVLRHIEMGDSQ
mgnify:CR=1 FL=1